MSVAEPLNARVRNLWNPAEAPADPVDCLVYASNLLGSDPRITASARTTILRHELSHGEFFSNPAYAEYVHQWQSESSRTEGNAVYAGVNAYTGDFTLHGVTKPVTFTLVGGKKGEFPKGVQRTGFSTELTIKRSEFGMDKALEAVGDDVHIAISFEGTRK